MRDTITARLAAAAALTLTALVVAGGASAAGPHWTHPSAAIAVEQSRDVVRPDDRATHGPGAIDVERFRQVARPDDRTTHGPGAIEAEQVREAAHLRALPSAEAGFDWADAGVGAVAMLGLVLLAAGGSVVWLRHRPEPRVT